MSFLKSKKFIISLSVLILIFISGFKFLNDKFIIGFQHPESAYFYDNYIFVSNIGASAMSKNLDGFITKLDNYGNILEYKFIDKLQAPKGIYVNNNILYVADLNRVCIINVNTKHMRCLKIMDSKFLNDIFYINGIIYVTDTMADKIYDVENNKVETFFYRKNLSPNGIVFSDKLNAFLVVSFNKPIVNIISMSGKLIKSIYIKGFTGFDGITIEKNSVFISDYKTGRVIKSGLHFKHIKIIKNFKTPAADISAANNKIMVPLLEADKLYIGNIKK